MFGGKWDMQSRTFYNEILTEHNLHPAHKESLPDANLIVVSPIVASSISTSKINRASQANTSVM